MHPGISAEFGYDSNYYQRADSEIEEQNIGPVEDTWRLRVTPAFVIRTVDKRLAEAGASAGTAPLFSLQLSADATGNVFFSDAVKDERHIQGGAGMDFVLLPGRTWSFDASGDYRRIVDPSNLPGFVNSYDRSAVSAGAGVTWRPGGGLFDWRLIGYQLRATLFEDDVFESFNNLDHRLETRGRWRFLPRSAAIFDGQYKFLTYTEPTDQNGGQAVRARLGYNGLVTDRLGFLAMGGWAASFYDDDVQPAKDYDGFIANAELTWFLTARSTLGYQTGAVGLSSVAIGYTRDFTNSYLGDFYARDRGYAKLAYMAGGVVALTAEAGFARVNYPSFSVADQGGGRFTQPAFAEDRIDAKVFAEYRPVDSVGVNATLQYDESFSQVVRLSSTDPEVGDDLDYARWQAYIGVRWFL